MMFRYYKSQLKEYERQSKGLQDAKTLIQARVSDAKAELLKGNESAREWLLVLKRSTSASQAYISFQVAQKYLESLHETPTPTTISNWLSTWEHAMMGAIKHNIPEIGSGRWLRDLALAIQPVSDVLNAIFITESTDDQKTNPSRYLEASVRIRSLSKQTCQRKDWSQEGMRLQLNLTENFLVMNTVKMLGIRRSLSKEPERRLHRRIHPKINDVEMDVGHADSPSINYLTVFMSSLSSAPRISNQINPLSRKLPERWTIRNWQSESRPFGRNDRMRRNDNYRRRRSRIRYSESCYKTR